MFFRYYQSPVPKEVIHSIGPSVLSIINNSLATGHVPSWFKHAIIHPLIKKENLDTSIPGNYRPLYKLSFLSKVLEKVVLWQLTSYPDSHSILDRFHSGFRRNHSRESASVCKCVQGCSAQQNKHEASIDSCEHPSSLKGFV